MSKREDAKEILKSLGLPKQQQNERSCLTLLALGRVIREDAMGQDTSGPCCASGTSWAG